MMFTEKFMDNCTMQIFYLRQIFNNPIVFIFISAIYTSK